MSMSSTQPPIQRWCPNWGGDFEKMAYYTTCAALDDAGIGHAELDRLTIGACDELNGLAAFIEKRAPDFKLR